MVSSNSKMISRRYVKQDDTYDSLLYDPHVLIVEGQPVVTCSIYHYVVAGVASEFVGEIQYWNKPTRTFDNQRVAGVWYVPGFKRGFSRFGDAIAAFGMWYQTWRLGTMSEERYYNQVETFGDIDISPLAESWYQGSR